MLALMLAPHSWAQTTVKEMRRRVSGLQQQIKEKERILLSSEKDVASKMKNLNLLTARIDEQKGLIALLTTEVTAIEREISALAAEIAKDEAKIEKSHCNRYNVLLNNVRKNSVFHKNDKINWKCSNCGYEYIGHDAPSVCPVCNHPRAFFRENLFNYL